VTATVVRADALQDKWATWRAFRSSPSGRVLLPVAVALGMVRLLVGDWGRGDLAVVAAIALLTGPLEWFVHRSLLHADPQAWTSRRLGIGSGHREHHVDPPELRWLLLPGLDAAIFLVVLLLLALVWAPAAALAVGGAVWTSLLTAATLTAAALAHYEWVHLLVHTSYRPRSRYYARLARNHRWHHYRNEGHWLGVTSNLGDRLFRTYHTTAGAVPISGTARTLGSSD
jgi:hypothetical protein